MTAAASLRCASIEAQRELRARPVKVFLSLSRATTNVSHDSITIGWRATFHPVPNESLYTAVYCYTITKTTTNTTTMPPANSDLAAMRTAHTRNHPRQHQPTQHDTPHTLTLVVDDT